MVISASDDPDELPSRPNVNVIIAPHIIAQASPSVSICAPPSHSAYVWLYSDTLPTNCIRTDTAVHQMLLSTIPWETLKTEHSAGKENIHVEFIVISVCAENLGFKGVLFLSVSLLSPFMRWYLQHNCYVSENPYIYKICVRCRRVHLTFYATYMVYFKVCFVFLLHKRHIMYALFDPGQHL